MPGGDEAAQLDAMDFPDLGTTVEKRKDKMPPSRSKGGGGGGGGGGDRRGQPTSALQSMIEGRAGGAAGGASGGASGDRERASSGVVPAEAHLGPPPKPVAEPDEAAHKEATAQMQASIDEIEKSVVRSQCSCVRAACGVMCRGDMAAMRVRAILTGAAASCLPAPAVETLGRVAEVAVACCLLQDQLNEEIEELKSKRGEHREGVQGVRNELKAHRDKIRAATAEREAMTEELKAASEEVKRQEAKTASIADELVSTDPVVVDGKIAEVQKQIEAGNLGFKAEKELIKEIKTLTVS